jgi:phosphoglycolate phosphatase-like HAD superfamily hydrolase
MLPQPISKIEKQDILDRQGKRYRADYLPRVHAFPGVRAPFEYFKATAIRVALGTDLPEGRTRPLSRPCLHPRSDRCRGVRQRRQARQTHPDVFELARRRSKVRMRGSIVRVGDTPYDAAAARTAGMAAVGVLTGHFAASDLLASGSLATFPDPRALPESIKSGAESSAALAEAS